MAGTPRPCTRWHGRRSLAAPIAEDKWELYNTAEDFSCAIDLAAKDPDKLKEMQDAFMAEAVKYNVLPLDDRVQERFNATIAGRPDFMGGRTSLTVYPGMIGMKENAFIDVKNRSSSITADLEIPPSGASGVILAQGGAHSGWSLYVKDGKPKFAYNFLGAVTTIASERAPARRPGHASPTILPMTAASRGRRHRDALDQREEGRLRQNRAHHSVHLRS